MKIIHCLHHFLPQQVGGTEVYVHELALSLVAAGMEAIVLIPGFDRTSNEEYVYKGIRVISYAENSLESRAMIAGRIAPDGIHNFLDVIKNEHPDVVHFHELASGRGINIFHVEAVKKLGYKVVLTFHQNFYSCFTGTLSYKGKTNCDGLIDIKRCVSCALHAKNITGIGVKGLEIAGNLLFDLNLNATKLNSKAGTALGFPFVIKKLKTDLLKLILLADKIIVLADWYQKMLIANGAPEHKLVTVAAGNNTTINRLRSPISLPLKIIYVGRITEVKGLHLLLDALKEFGQDVRLDIYGQETDITYTQYLKKQTEQMLNVVWHGVVSREDLQAAFSRSHLLCIPSYAEMRSLVLLEAMQYEIPVLASDCHGNRELIDHAVNGFLFENKKGRDLAKKIKMIIDDTTILNDLRFSVLSGNSTITIGEKHSQLYKSVAGKVIV